MQFLQHMHHSINLPGEEKAGILLYITNTHHDKMKSKRKNSCLLIRLLLFHCSQVEKHARPFLFANI